MYKVFHGNRCIRLIGFINSSNFTSANQHIHIQQNTQFCVELFSYLKSAHEDLDIVSVVGDQSLFKSFSSCFSYEKAAGGLVRNGLGEWLFIYRNGHWDLPKGHIEKNEEPDSCALREVEEETAVVGLTLVNKLITTYHIYPADRRWIMKETSWYGMVCDDDRPKTVPQFSEGIQSADWVPPESLPLILGLSFRSIRDELGPIMLENRI
jgi:8-oxo-dGTP pyrophosphatase MutT (NUDIX family)